MKATFLETEKFKISLEKEELSSCIKVTGRIVAFSGIAPCDEYTVGAPLKTPQDEEGIDPARAGNSHDLNIWWILEP